MPILQDKQKGQLKELFKGLAHEVKIILFSQEFECEHCRITREMLTELAGLSEKIRLSVLDFQKDAAEAKQFGVDKIPGIVIMGERDLGVRFYGVPAGYEFTPLVEDVIAVGKGGPGLSPELMAELKKIDQPVHLEVIVSPTCPYCPAAVRAAHRLALASDHVRADMIESVEFPHLVNKYNVQGVPHTVINEAVSFVGPVPELDLVYSILMTLGKEVPKEFLDRLSAQAEHKHEPEHDHGQEHRHDREPGPGSKKERGRESGPPPRPAKKPKTPPAGKVGERKGKKK